MKRIRILAIGISLILISVLMLPMFVTAEDATGELIFHFVNVGNSDAILLELDGKYAMIDAGESTDFPDGTDPQYPARSGIETSGYQQKLIGYLNSLGIQNLEFLLLTNATSSHMDGASYIINSFNVSTVYMNTYNDSYITADEKRFDNMYCYDKTLRAIEGKQPKTKLVQHFSTLPTSENGNPLITFGNAQIELFNSDTAKTLVVDEKLHSIVPVVSYCGKKALIGSSILNNDGAIDKITKKVGSVQLLKLQNHGLDDGTDAEDAFITQLKPYVTVNTGYFSTLSFNRLSNLQRSGTTMFLTEESDQAVKLSFSQDATFTLVECKSDPCVYYKAASSTWCGLRGGNLIIDDFLDFYFQFESVRYYFAEDGNAIYNNFFVKDGNTYYSNAYGIIQKGWINVGKEKYYCNSDGVLQTGIQEIDGRKYYFDNSGALKKGLQIIDGICYYFDPSSGVMKTGIQKIGGKEYYFDASGAMKTGLVETGGYTYYFDSTGQKKTKFQVIGSKTYYFDPKDNGRMVTGLKKINGSYYGFNKKGVMQTGWVKYKKGTRYFNEDGVMQTGWITVGKNQYCLDNMGYKQVGWYKYLGNTYYLGKNGAMRKGWQQIRNSYYNFGKDGIMKVGWQTIKDKVYYFKENGKAVVGWKNIGGSWYYFNDKGEKQTGWVAVDEKAYYLDPENGGAMAIGWKTIGNATYYFDETGERRTGWLELGGDKFYLNESGELLTGVYYIDEKACYFDENGKLIKNYKFNV